MSLVASPCASVFRSYLASMAQFVAHLTKYKDEAGGQTRLTASSAAEAQIREKNSLMMDLTGAAHTGEAPSGSVA